MFCAVDVHYEADRARAACILFDDWTSPSPAGERVTVVTPVEPYVPGEFYRRELPPILSVLGAIGAAPAVVIVDGYVWLDASGTPGLGARLHQALGGRCAVVGVAKTAFKGNTAAVAVTRGRSARPLFVSAAGVSLQDAVDGVRRMHGGYGIPELLQRVDHRARGIA